MIATISEVAFSAIVSGPDGVRFSTTAISPAVRSSDLAAYIRDRCDYTLWPATALTVRRLLDAGRLDDAIEMYFAHVGSRWDEERLELREVGCGSASL
jgi:hypothetical protein